ncbi:sentrin-specific protease 8-like isoform X1 [Tubulanus polymorphus]|uniref:sentrin-specific protease 8-like isoform X1 n=1 Tax=Tubulanus polymorphus TaxID=672921 RepID=UPI003DA5443A
MADDRVCLSYEDSLLRESDVKLLDPPNWLNDAIIGFCFEYFSNEEFVNHPFSFVSPEVTQFMKFADVTELGLFLEPLDLPNKEAIFLAVNDNADVNHTGGSHWSLLLYHRRSNQFEHYDSSNGSNSTIAATLVHKIWTYLATECKPKYKEISDAPQQVNSHDCGVYCICFVQYLAQQLSPAADNDKTMKDAMSPAAVSAKRNEWKHLIWTLANN